ncbi:MULTISPECIES: bifunctional 3-phenylpropionate/cinnamic acid dioxygenase ferredoxin subunit [Burkholderia]|uniref:bifunctional 3-phenylpropionate/cinnamic acid dioxygenase ferredoxin subunit n=1 Tax=Burkholderia TaxID=32008 RepID=UPI0006D89C44|nr:MULTISPECIES: bifunctional 3-phenylpropionate/cinnamic acid dioxygenase ferredoxin subunit [Burkholderia]ALK30083.1 initial dioxygenase ferredoxin subunit [Burkholderia plantarii]MDN7754856.1 bifunctional 3-phenylpropionate/cinnamic acid dioxygenase ferredoxin subunit [Burkholderia gladioli]GLZ23195.1 bifunctional 3-phenylpropionate/cinnamic acid dioxygenase ferredoxin subunit [Burkholderia plantarii]
MSDGVIWIKACDASAIDCDDVLKIESSAGPIAIYHLQDGFFATQDTCTHAVASLADGFVEDGMIECPLHAAKFCIRTGKARSLPAKDSLVTYAVKVQEGDVLVGLPVAQELSS